MDIKLLNYSAGPMKADSDLWGEITDRSDINSNVICRLSYTPGKDVIGMQFDFTFSNDDKLLIKTGFLFGMRIDGLAGYISESLPEETVRTSITDILSFVWPYVVGAMAARCAEKSIELILPSIDYAGLAKEVILSVKQGGSHGRESR